MRPSPSRTSEWGRLLYSQQKLYWHCWRWTTNCRSIYVQFAAQRDWRSVALSSLLSLSFSSICQLTSESTKSPAAKKDRKFSFVVWRHRTSFRRSFGQEFCSKSSKCHDRGKIRESLFTFYSWAVHISLQFDEFFMTKKIQNSCSNTL